MTGEGGTFLHKGMTAYRNEVDRAQTVGVHAHAWADVGAEEAEPPIQKNGATKCVRYRQRSAQQLVNQPPTEVVQAVDRILSWGVLPEDKTFEEQDYQELSETVDKKKRGRKQ